MTVHEVEHTTNYYPPPYPILVTYQRENPITTSTPNTPDSNIPDTVNELLQQNSQPIPPEELWEKVKELNPGDQQVFSYNIVDYLRRFHEFVIEDMDCNDPSYSTWIQDLERLKMCSILLDSLSS